MSTGQPWPPPGCIKEQLGTIFKQISEAQTLDVNGDEMGAYRHYLSSVALAAQVLSGDIQANQGQGTLPEQQIEQLYKMARQCLDRGHDIFATARKERRPLALFRLATPSPTTSPTFPYHSSQASHPSQPHPSQPQPHPSQQLTQSLPRLKAPPSLPAPQNTASMQGAQSYNPDTRRMTLPANARRNPSQGNDYVDGIPGGASGGMKGNLRQDQHRSQSTSAVHAMPYMAEAKMRNRHMMEQYKSHLRQQYSGKPVNNEAGLSMLRRLEENLSVAKIREQNIAKRLKEKEFRAREQGGKTKPAVVLSKLSTEDLSEQVSSFEHGKATITNIKTRLNGSNSDPSMVYAIVSEILSITDHPLSRVLGEYQYDIYNALLPVGAAVEKAGGFPKLDIRLDNSGLDRKPSIEDMPRPPDPPGGDDSDDLLDLLCDDDDDDVGSFPVLIHQSDQSRGAVGSNTFDSKLELLKKELMSGEGEGEEGENGAGKDTGPPHTNENGDNFGSKNGEQVYQNISNSHLYQNVTGCDEDTVLSGAPEFDGFKEEDDHDTENFDLQENTSYSGIGKAPPIDATPTSRGAVYEDMDEIAKCLKEGGGGGIVEAQNPQYGVADSVFSNTDSEGHIYDIPDGGMLSQQVEVAPPPIEMEEMLPFKNLPPLVCSAHLGDEVAMLRLADTATSVLANVVQQIHSSLEKLLQCFCRCYPMLRGESNKEVCRTVLEASFFPPITSPLSIVYRCKNYQEEVAVAKNMCRQVNASPRDLAVRKKYWLLEQSHAPYGEAIDELRRVVTFRYPSPKLECLVHMSKQVVKCIEDYHKKYHSGSKVDLLGVDDMLPILSYVILRSGLPELISECSIMEEFIQDGYIMGEEGFCLTSFLTALKYVTQMSC